MSLFLAYIFEMIPLLSPNPFGTVLPPLLGLFFFFFFFMVPSDPSGSLISSRYTRPERGIRNGVMFGPLLPAPGFARLRIEALVRTRCPLPVEAHFPMRPFTL
jgi:hypothetical protein